MRAMRIRYYVLGDTGRRGVRPCRAIVNPLFEIGDGLAGQRSRGRHLERVVIVEGLNQ